MRALLALFPVTALAIPIRVDHSGRLLDASGDGLQGGHNVTLSLYADAGGSSLLFRETFTGLPVEGGYYSVTLTTNTADGEPLDSSVFATDVWIGVSVDGTSDLLPREQISSVPRAASVEGLVRPLASNADCDPADPSTHGRLRYDASAITLQLCTPAGWAGVFSRRTILDTPSGKTWSDGSVAATCDAYRNPTSAFDAYEGDIGSGTYRVDPEGDGTSIAVQCEQDTDGGGWAVLADDDYAAGDACPGALSAVNAGTSVNARLCWRNIGAAGARSATFTPPYAYTEVRSALTGHQWWSMDAFGTPTGTNPDSIYVDGASLTRGSSPRNHLFTWAVGLSTSVAGTNNCPGVAGGEGPVAFVGTTYACESGNPTTHTNTWYSPLLFDDVEPTLTLGSPTTEILELRVMSDQAGADNEDLGVRTFRLWVR